MLDLPRMTASFLAIMLVISGASSFAQAPPPATPAPPSTPVAPEAKSHVSPLGFSYSIPTDWEVVDAQGTLPRAKEEADKNATTDEEKKGLACVQVALTARHGEPASVLVEVALPFDCFGAQMTEKDLPGFAQGTARFCR